MRKWSLKQEEDGSVLFHSIERHCQGLSSSQRWRELSRRLKVGKTFTTHAREARCVRGTTKEIKHPPTPCRKAEHLSINLCWTGHSRRDLPISPSSRSQCGRKPRHRASTYCRLGNSPWVVLQKITCNTATRVPTHCLTIHSKLLLWHNRTLHPTIKTVIGTTERPWMQRQHQRIRRLCPRQWETIGEWNIFS